MKCDLFQMTVQIHFVGNGALALFANGFKAESTSCFSSTYAHRIKSRSIVIKLSKDLETQFLRMQMLHVGPVTSSFRWKLYLFEGPSLKPQPSKRNGEGPVHYCTII